MWHGKRDGGGGAVVLTKIVKRGIGWDYKLVEALIIEDVAWREQCI